MKTVLYRLLTSLFMVIVAVFLVSCATTRPPDLSQADLNKEKHNQLVQIYQEQRVNNHRVRNLIWPLLRNNLPVCGKKTTRTFGFNVALPQDVDQESERKAYSEVYSFDGKPVISTVTAGSPAAQSGLEPGDQITGINDWKWKSENSDEFLKRTINRIRDRREKGSMTLTVARGGDPHTVEIVPVVVCRATVETRPDQKLNASTNGNTISVYRGLLERMSDDDIQTVLAHELAHNTLGHIGKITPVRSAGLLVDIGLLAGYRVWLGPIFSRLAGSTTSVQLEREADYVAMYLLANAGLDTANRADIWRLLNDFGDLGSSYFRTHPTSPERYLTMKKTHEEIVKKQSAGEALVPRGMRVRD